MFNFKTFSERVGTYDGHKGAVWCCDVDWDSKYLITGGADANCLLWSVRDGTMLMTLPHRGAVRAVAWAEGDNMFVTITNPFKSMEASFTIYGLPADRDVSSMDEKPILDVTETPLEKGERFICVLWLPLNEGIMIGASNGSIYVFEPKTGKLVSNLNPRLHCLMFKYFSLSLWESMGFLNSIDELYNADS